LAIAWSSAFVPGCSARAAAARFSLKWFSEDAPGMSRILGERWSKHASATCIGVACKEPAIRSSTDDCNGVNPPNGKNGTYAMPCCTRASMKASSRRCANYFGDRLSLPKLIRGDAAETDVTNQPLTLQLSKCLKGSSIDRSVRSMLPPTRRLTTSSRSTPRLRSLS
jgi:hypothetical protein